LKVDVFDAMDLLESGPSPNAAVSIDFTEDGSGDDLGRGQPGVESLDRAELSHAASAPLDVREL